MALEGPQRVGARGASLGRACAICSRDHFRQATSQLSSNGRSWESLGRSSGPLTCGSARFRPGRQATRSSSMASWGASMSAMAAMIISSVPIVALSSASSPEAREWPSVRSLPSKVVRAAAFRANPVSNCVRSEAPIFSRSSSAGMPVSASTWAWRLRTPAEIFFPAHATSGLSSGPSAAPITSPAAAPGGPPMKPPTTSPLPAPLACASARSCLFRRLRARRLPASSFATRKAIRVRQGSARPSRRRPTASSSRWASPGGRARTSSRSRSPYWLTSGSVP